MLELRKHLAHAEEQARELSRRGDENSRKEGEKMKAECVSLRAECARLRAEFSERERDLAAQSERNGAVEAQLQESQQHVCLRNRLTPILFRNFGAIYSIICHTYLPLNHREIH